jgi:hypothetical protein
MLGYAVLVGVEDSCVGVIAHRAERIAEAYENRALVPFSKIRDVLKNDRSRFQFAYNSRKALPEICPSVLSMPDSSSDQAPDL